MKQSAKVTDPKHEDTFWQKGLLGYSSPKILQLVGGGVNSLHGRKNHKAIGKRRVASYTAMKTEILQHAK